MITAEMISQYLTDARQYNKGHMVRIEFEDGRIITAVFRRDGNTLHLDNPYISVNGDRLEWTAYDTRSTVNLTMVSSGLKVATVSIYVPSVTSITHYDEEWLCVRGDVA